MTTISLHTWSGSGSTLGSGLVVGEDVTFDKEVRLTAVGFQAGATATAARIGVAVWDGTTLFASNYKTNQSISAGTYHDVAFDPAPVLEAGKTYRIAVYVEASGYFPHGMYTARGGAHSHGGGGFTATLGATSFYATSGPETVRPTTTYSYEASHRYQVEATNVPPNAPALTAPADGSTIDRNSVQRFDWDFSDPDAGDSQSAYNLRYRLIGAGTWTETGWVSLPTTYHDLSAGTLAAGDYEWQVSTKDAQGVEGPFSGSSFFTAATAPPAPTITDPINGETIGLPDETITWSAPDQSAYQLRRVADNAGTADPATVYEDTGEVTSASARSRPVTFATNDRYEHLQVRIKHNGLWSSWASIRVLVSYTPPPIPGVNLAASGAGLVVTVFNPSPGAGEPPVTHNEVYVDDGAGETRRVAQLVPNGSWTYQTPRSGRDYTGQVRVVAIGDNGTRSSS